MPLDIQALARLGATTRLQEIDAERNAIFATFPDLRDRPGEPAVIVTAAQVRAQRDARLARETAKATNGNGHTPTKRVYWSQTPAGRKQISKRLKAYWAARRAAKGSLKA